VESNVVFLAIEIILGKNDKRKMERKTVQVRRTSFMPGMGAPLVISSTISANVEGYGAVSWTAGADDADAVEAIGRSDSWVAWGILGSEVVVSVKDDVW
jgi:hypothetical protein